MGKLVISGTLNLFLVLLLIVVSLDIKESYKIIDSLKAQLVTTGDNSIKYYNEAKNKDIELQKCKGTYDPNKPVTTGIDRTAPDDGEITPAEPPSSSAPMPVPGS